jgi:O-acetyl-ADP-ribose deacetylase (regulator of RNase III)
MRLTVGNSKLVLLEGDITRIPADAIVNAANARLAGGGGVDGAIHRAGGASIMAELDELRPRIGGACETGEAVVTGAGELPAKWVIHAVGPMYRDGACGEDEKLASCYRTAMKLAEQLGAKTISFPSISTGVYGYPMNEAADIALATVCEALRSPECTVEEAIFVLFGEKAYDEHARAAKNAAAPQA